MMMLKIKLDTENSLDKYCSELNDLLNSIENDKNNLISLISEFHGNIQDKEYIRSCIDEKIFSFHNLFLNKCYQIIEDIYYSHEFEIASPQNLLYITLETKQKLFEFYVIYQYQLFLDYFDKVIKFKYNDIDYDSIKTNNILNDYIKLENNINVKVDHRVMINYIYQIIKNHGNIDN